MAAETSRLPFPTTFANSLANTSATSLCFTLQERAAISIPPTSLTVTHRLTERSKQVELSEKRRWICLSERNPSKAKPELLI